MRPSFHLPRLGILIVTLVLALRVSGATSETQASVPTRYVVGLSPFLDNGVKNEVFRQIAGFVLEGMPIGSSLALYDAYRIRTIATISIPEVAAFRSGKTRATQFKGELNKLKRFLAEEQSESDSRGLPLVQAVRFPQFLDFVSDHLGAAGSDLVILILGNPLYIDPKEPGCSMVDGYFPSDGHLRAGKEQSVFGVREGQRGLTNAVVHFGALGDPWVSDVHGEKVLRFWTLFAATRGARLGAFSSDLPTVFAAMKPTTEASDPVPVRFKLDPAQTKVEMLRITRDIGVADWITKESLPGNPPPPATRVGPMKIGIRWQGNLDLDLYATPKPGADTLFFEHPRSSEGYYFKDHRSSPLREYEFIEFESPVDVGLVNSRINFYAGNASDGPAGEVRIEFDGRIYSRRFSIPAHHGNEGREGPDQRKCWTTLDVPGILGLTSGSR